MSITTLFKSLRAPLANSRWSWGASNPDCVVLRVWRDERVTEDGVMKVLVYAARDDIADKTGQHERIRHLKEIETGKPCYLIMCEPDSSDVLTRKIKSFDKNQLYIGGNLLNDESGKVFIEIVDRLKVIEFLKKYEILPKP